MAICRFEHQVIVGKRNRLTIFQAMLVDEYGAPVSGITFNTNDVTILKYIDGDWDVESYIIAAPVEIGGTGVYLFQLSSSEVNPDDDKYPVGVKVSQEGDDNYYGFFTIRFDTSLDTIIDTDITAADALKEILAYASCTTERDVETGTITYRNRSGEIIFTLTPGISGRVRGPVIPNIMNHIMNHHFNNPS